MSSMLTQDLCIGCNLDNGINSGTNCKFCREPLCKNKWKIELESSANLIMSGNSKFDCFEKSLVKEYEIEGKKGFMYKFSFEKFDINFEKESLKFWAIGLNKPIIIRFDCVTKYYFNSGDLSGKKGMMLYINDSLIVYLGYNSHLVKLFSVLDKWVNFDI